MVTVEGCHMDFDTLKAWLAEPPTLWVGGLLLLAAIALIPLLRGRRKRVVPARQSEPVPASEPAPTSPAIPAAMEPPPRAAAPEKTMTKASDLFIACLEQEGVEYVFGVPGEENLDFLDSLSRSSKIKLILTRHEQGAGFMASTYGRHTGKAGVCLATLGPGATNFVTAAAYAQLGGMPMLMITGQKPIKSSKQGRFQILDVVDMMRPITKYTHQLASADNIPARVREAFRLAQEEKPGATHLEFPEDIAHEQTASIPIPESRVRRPVPDHKSIQAAVDRIARAKSPLLVIGAGANRKLTSRMLTEFVEKTGIPFITTQLGKGVIDERNPKYLGCAALSSGDFVHRAVDTADVIINVGHDVIEKPPFFMKHGGCDVIHVSFRTAEVDPVYFPQIEVVGDIANAVWQIKERLAAQPHWDFAALHRFREAEVKHSAAAVGDMRFPVYPQHLVDQVRKAMPDDGILCLDNGVYKIWFTRNYPAYMPNTLLVDNALATMGAGLPSAMASAMVFPGRKVLAVCGDGGFMMNSQELETAVRLGLNLTVLIMNDNSYGMIRWKQANMGFKDWGLTYGNPDFVKYAESYGAHGHRATTAEELPGLLRQCLDTPGVHLLEVPVDYSDNDRILNREIRELSAAL
jgi:acetolactate synthase-1/2/3 large subunit